MNCETMSRDGQKGEEKKGSWQDGESIPYETSFQDTTLLMQTRQMYYKIFRKIYLERRNTM